MPQVPPATLAQVPLVAAPPPGGAAPRKHRERVDSQRPSAKLIDTKARSQSETFPSRLPPAPAKVINEILDPVWRNWGLVKRSEEHTSELQSLMRISYAVFCLKKKMNTLHIYNINTINKTHNPKNIP